jgi:hypothetical protein
MLVPDWRFATQLASAATGQMGPPKDSWWTTAPLVPFLVLAMQIVALSALRRVASLAECNSSIPSFHRQMSLLRNGIVRFSLAWAGDIFSDPQEIEECLGDQVRHHVQVRVPSVVM